MLRFQTFLITCGLLLSGACGSWTGNPPRSKVETGTTGTGTTAPVDNTGSVEIVLQGTGTSLQKNTLSVTDKSGNAAGQIVITSVQVQLASITLRKSSSDTESRPALTGPFQLDLLTNAITPTPDQLKLPPGDYQDLRMNLYKPGSGSSLILIGTYVAANQSSSNVRIALDAQDEIAFLNGTEAKVTVAAGANTKIALSFQLNKWFNFKGKDIDLSAYAGKDLTIDASTAASDQVLRQTFLGNVKAATDFDKITGSGDDKDNNHPRPDGRGRH